MLKAKLDFETRFWSNVSIAGHNDCWPWLLFRNPKGHGRGGTSKNGSFLAHRMAFQLHWGVILPSWLQVCHDCPGRDNPACCNPAHLFVSDAKGHTADKKAKGQLSCGQRHSDLKRATQVRGERVPNAKLTDRKVRTMRLFVKRGLISQSEAHRIYQTSRSVISEALRGVTWRHVK
jgi:hypothetical protein